MTREGLLCALLTVLALPMWLLAQAGVAPKVLFDPAQPGPAKLLAISTSPASQVSSNLSKEGLTVHIKAGDAAYPGASFKPADSAPWNLGLYGHVEAKITNTGAKRVNLSLRVDNEGDHTKQPWNSESKVIEPGQTKTLRVYFGYSYGYRPGFKLKPEAVTQLLFFTGKTSDDLDFRIERVQGAGWVGEKIGIDPDRVGRKPANGVILDAATTFNPVSQIGAAEGAKGSAGPDGKSIQIDFAGGKDESVTFRPAEGLWNLNEHLQVKVQIKNVGQAPITPAVRVESEGGPTDLVSANSPLAPGAQTQIVIPFAGKLPWTGVPDPGSKTGWKRRPDSGTEYRSNVTTGITFLSDKTPGAKSLLVTSIVADVPTLELPQWLGQRPPVAGDATGDWVQTLAEEFDGNSIDLHRWNVHAHNWWDKRMHFSKDQVIVKDGMLALRLEKKPGHHNDDPKQVKTDYAAGQPDSFGKWTQRYGYFEIRQKQPTARCMWPGFWMVPDRGLKSGLDRGARGSTANGGMEFDITESQSSWGIHRFNIACHWDNYGPEHKALGTSSNYVQADKDGFIVVGLLWTPGSYVIYGNGKEIYRWDSPRVSNQQQFMILQNEIGGWDNEEVDDSQLPADFLVDYIRVWQRKDLATPDDGPKPNKGDYDAFNEKLPDVK